MPAFKIPELLAYRLGRLLAQYDFGISGNFISLLLVIEQVKKAWYKWLCRRSQRKRLTWERFADLLRDFPLPRPRIMVSLWGA